jgi:hypothetical protein
MGKLILKHLKILLLSRFIDLLHEAPLSGHREPRSIVGGTLYCILLVSGNFLPMFYRA